MCGFGGVINNAEPLQAQQLSKVASKVMFRGPDSCGIRIFDESLHPTESGSHGIFFNRLAIIDIDSRSDQPFEDDRYLLVFNGEIYNYKELRCELEKKQIRFRTTSDTEVLFYALREWGADVLERLNGMFAFFWMDKLERKFMVARDRLGIKPLYYSQQGNTFHFSSELHSILRLSTRKPVISTSAVDMYLWMQFIPAPYTIIDGINKLPPGNYIQGNIDKSVDAHPVCYWDAYKFINSNKYNNTSDLETILKNSLDRQLHADVPLGLFLSSGTDSSLLAALVNKYFASNNDVNFFTVQFEENTISDESSEARAYINKFNNPRLHCNTISINPVMIQDHLNDLYDYYDEPFGDHASLLNWMISRKAKEHVTVAISGDGADELFWGYNRYDRWRQFSRINNVPILPSLARTIGQLLPKQLSDNIRFVLEKDPVKRHFNLFLPSGMRHKIRNHITRYPIWAMDGVDAVASRNDLPSVLDIKTYLADAMLYKVDRSGMASSLEVRVPYLDNEVLEYALTLPLSEKSTHRFQNKAPLKELLTKLAPHYDIRKPKKGFNFPLRKWLKENWKDQVLSIVNKNDLESAGIEAKPYLKMLEDFYSSRINYFTDVWYVFNLALWMKKLKSIERL